MRSTSLRVWPAAFVAAVAIGLIGCGENGASNQSGPSATPVSATAAPVDAAEPTNSVSTAQAPVTPDYRQQAVRAVRAYYRAIDDSDYGQAWRSLTPAVHAAMGGYGTWKGGFATSVSTRVTSAVAIDATSSRAEVAITLRSVDVDACASQVTQHFKGEWALVKSAGSWVAERIVMRKTSGATPVLDVNSCPGTTSDTGDVCDPSSAAYDQVACDDQSGASDSGDPCDPNSSAYDPSVCGDTSPGGSDGSFCTTHACIDNFSEGTGYIVECSDGEWSHSGGRPGACSYHGGETDVTGP